jgi:hypothetical protein
VNKPAATLLRRWVETTKQRVWTAQGCMMSISCETSLCRCAAVTLEIRNGDRADDF